MLERCAITEGVESGCLLLQYRAAHVWSCWGIPDVIFPPPPPLVGGFSLVTLEKYGIRIKPAHDTGTEEQHQPLSCSHQNHYVTSGLREIIKRKANWIGHILRRNCLLKQVIEGKIKGQIEVTRRQEECVRSYWTTLRTGEDTVNWRRKL